MKHEPIDAFAAAQSEERREAVRTSSKAGHEKRTLVLYRDFPEADRLRAVAAQIKEYVLDHLEPLLEQAVSKLEERGATVHFASDAAAARRIVGELCARRGARRVVKAKSMATEEIELNPYLEGLGIESVETDLGELIVQLGKDRPSHIVKPIIHQHRREIAATFAESGLGPYDDTPEVITRRARVHLREKFLAADVAVTGANFVSAESGRLVIVTNEGNSRFCLAATRCHVAVVGIEKLLPRERDLSLFLNLLARSATGQPLTVYTELIGGPRSPEQPDGPEEMHVVFLDNGRSRVLASEARSILRCIRCGACLNVCPVYRQASGHAYRGVYPGPLGAVLSPLLEAEGFADKADLPRASTLCGACHEVCPVDIPIEELLVRMRSRGKREGLAADAAPSFGPFAWLATEPEAWGLALEAGGLASALPRWLAPGPLGAWRAERELPTWRGGRFRQWLESRRGAP